MTSARRLPKYNRVISPGSRVRFYGRDEEFFARRKDAEVSFDRAEFRATGLMSGNEGVFGTGRVMLVFFCFSVEKTFW